LALAQVAAKLAKNAQGKPNVSISVTLINGPNLNLLGLREPEIYGAESLADVEARCVTLAGDLGLAVSALQSNHEGEIVEMIHAARGHAAAIIINPGAYSHTSVAILDALNAYEGLVIEVHISNIHKRETFRHHSFVSARAEAVILGCGTEGYLLALRRVASLLGV
jgi:3-dehydroquinate dehydratase-2